MILIYTFHYKIKFRQKNYNREIKVNDFQVAIYVKMN